MLGVILILTGWWAEDRHYLSSFLLEAGSTVLLVLPLLWVERIFEARISETEQQTARQARQIEHVAERLDETRQSVADLQRQTSERLEAAASAEDSLARNAREDLTFATFRELFERALKLNAISEHGLRVAVPGQWERLVFRRLYSVEKTVVSESAAAPVFMVHVEAASGSPLNVRLAWGAEESPSDFLVRLAETWKPTGTYPGDSAIDAGLIFARLIDSLDIAIRSRRTKGDTQLSPLIELISPTWTMTDYGLEHYPNYYVITRADLVADLAHWREHMRDKVWVGEENASHAVDGEPDFWMVSEVAHAFFAAHPEAGSEDVA